jgi:hypothetical protein
LTVGRAISSVALGVMKGENVGNICCRGLEMKASEAIITLAAPELHLTPLFKLKRGPARGMVPSEV